MKATTIHTHLYLRRDCLILSLLSLLLLHVGKCQAQSDSSNIPFIVIPVVFVVVATLMCVCFWGLFCLSKASQRRRFYHHAPANARYIPQVFNSQRPYHGSGGAIAQPAPGSYPTQGYVVPSTTPATNQPQTRQAYPVQGYAPPSTATVSNVPPLAPSLGATQPQTGPQATTEPVASLPEATLHQGDAPPGYAEAVGMKTVDIAGQGEPQS